MNPFLVVLIVYGALLTLAGAFLARRTRNSSDFFVAGRKLGPGLMFATVLAANIGAGSTVGAAGLAYAIGLSGWWWVGSAGLGSLVLALAVGPRIRRLAAEHGFLTLGDFLEHRFGLAARLSVAVLLWAGTLAILAGQLIAFAWILQVVAGTLKTTGCLLGGVVVMTYFAAGGLKGAAWINLFQLAVKGTGFLLCVPFALAAAGGWEGLRAADLPADYFRLDGIGWQGMIHYLVLLAPSFIVSPGLLQKAFAGRDDRAVRLGIGANGVALLLFSALPVLLGMVAACRFPGLANPELALPKVITEVLPFWLGAWLLASVFSAEISSADAILFMLSTSLSQDLYRRVIRPSADDQTVLRVSRWTALASGLLGILCAIQLGSVLEALKLFYGLLSVALFVPVVAGLYHARPGGRVFLWALPASLAAAGLFHVLNDGRPIGPLSSTAVGIVVSAAIILPFCRWRGAQRAARTRSRFPPTPSLQ